ncbi:hypothetical protein MMC12_003103 [Toensbergia leucococca]|nr:hypothetical protein [Toensbergia leucococca]
MASAASSLSTIANPEGVSENESPSSWHGLTNTNHALFGLRPSNSAPSPSLDGAFGFDREDAAAHAPRSVRRHLTYFNCFALVLGLQIGSGIFSAPAVVASRVPSSIVGILIWASAGGLVWTGAASFMELGTIVPENGGIQEYLRHCYGDVYGFMFAWIWIFVVKPCSMAMVSLIFAEYLYRTVLPGADISTWVLKSTALLGIGFTTALNCMGTHLGVLSANVFMGVKVLGLSSIAVIGVAFQITSVIQGGSATEPEKLSPAMESPTQFQVSEQGSSLSWMGTGDLADALFAALFAYGGWESISFVVGEMEDPSRNLPRVLHHAMSVVISLFILANIAFYSIFPLEVVKTTNAIALGNVHRPLVWQPLDEQAQFLMLGLFAYRASEL